MNHPSKFTPVIISSFVMIFLSLFPVLNLLNLLCCAGIIIGGAAGTLYYAKQLEKIGEFIQNKDGIMIGLLAGIISAIIYVIFSTIIIMVSKQNPVEMVYQLTQQYGFNIPPESERMLRTVRDEYSQNGFSTIMIGVELFSRIVSHCIFGPLGGLLTASILNKRRNSV
jgi:predicted histidine transporter YuiF (NhaC family)